MYKSSLHSLLLAALESTTWTRSTKDEDNYRHVLCSGLYAHVSPNNVTIPSTRSGAGDIQLFGRKIELKYANNKKPVSVEGKKNSLAADFDQLLVGDIDFAILAVALDRSAEDNFVHQSVRLPKVAASGTAGNFADHVSGTNSYRSPALVIAGAYPHELTDINVKTGKGNRCTVYLSFESAPCICRSSFLKIQNHQVHVDVIGSKEDGLLCFLYKRADHVELAPASPSAGTQAASSSVAKSIAIPYQPAPLELARVDVVNVYSRVGKDLPATMPRVPVEQGVPVFTIF